MKYLATGIVAAAVLGLVALAPVPASAGYYGWGGGPGFGVYIGPRYPSYGYYSYGYRPYYQPYYRQPYYSYGYNPRWRQHRNRYYD
jgi:hypothetical protein